MKEINREEKEVLLLLKIIIRINNLWGGGVCGNKYSDLY